jgi:large subunit ribosomal protein L10
MASNFYYLAAFFVLVLLCAGAYFFGRFYVEGNRAFGIHSIRIISAQGIVYNGGEIMPNAKVLSEKQAIVAELVERLKASGSGVFVDYKGINVAQDTALRGELRKNEVDYTVIKNTYCRRAIAEVGLSEIEPILKGTTSLATSTGDPIAPFRVISEFAKKMGADKFNIKAGYMDGRVLTLSEISEISALPSKDALYAKVLGTMLAPISSLAVVLGQILEQKGGAAAEPAAE